MTPEMQLQHWAAGMFAAASAVGFVSGLLFAFSWARGRDAYDMIALKLFNRKHKHVFEEWETSSEAAALRLVREEQEKCR